MTYWNETLDLQVPLYRTSKYLQSKSFRENINDQGTMGDILAPSDVIFVGSCDVMSLVSDSTLRWSKKIHTELYHSSPYIALGSTSGGMPTIVRKLYSYISNFGPPKHVYLTVPRFDGYEYVNKSGKCYNVSSAVKTAEYALKTNIVNEDEAGIWLRQLDVNKKLKNRNNTLYILEERFAFIETICKLHSINLKWTFNTSGPSIRILYENLDLFKNISVFMKDAFVGMPEAKDNFSDWSIGPLTHTEIYNVFMNPKPWDYKSLCTMATKNYEWYTTRDTPRID